MASLRYPLPPRGYEAPGAAAAPDYVPEQALARLWVFAGVIALLLAVLVGRLWYLQVLRGADFRQAARANRSREVRVVAPRGVIEDGRGNLLVSNQAQFAVFVAPGELPGDAAARKQILDRLAGLLEANPDELAAEVASGQAANARVAGGADDPIPVAGDVNMRTLSRIAENRVRLPGVFADAAPVRVYPHGRLAAHLLGAIGQITPSELRDKKTTDLGYRAGDFIGKTGVEQTYNKFLTGTNGGTAYDRDARGRRVGERGTRAPVAGATVRLCLDTRVQQAGERALGGRVGAFVALDPRDGRVLALGSLPTYDPNVFARRPLKRAVYDALVAPDNNHPLQNRAVSSPQPPGSTFKVVTLAAGLATGGITPRTGDFCQGGIPMGRRIKRCHGVHHAVDVVSALAASCDVFFYHAGFRIGPTPLAEWSGRFGLGHRTGIDLPSEKAGTVPSPAWKAVMAPKFGNPDTGWYRGDTANMSIGQGDLQTTPLQMALVAAAIANGGTVYRPQVVERVTAEGTGRVRYQRKPEVLHRLPLAPDQIALIQTAMRSVVEGSGGTSPAARLPGIGVAGKSGSAETRGGGPTHGWFIAYAPAENPTIAVSVFLESHGQSYHGGADAAPVVRKMLAAYFGLKGDTTKADSGASNRSGARGD